MGQGTGSQRKGRVLRSKQIVAVGLALASLLVTACGPQAAPAATQRPGDQGQARAPKLLTIGMQREYDTANGGEGSDLLHDALVQDRLGLWSPSLAQEQISVERGTWVLNPDGSMDVTWKIKPNVRWHDGTAFTSADLLFSLQARQDPNTGSLAGGTTSTLRLITSAAAPDPLTFTMHWREVSVRANEAVGLTPLPKHLLEAAYQNNPATIEAQPYFRTEYVGLGPYRLVRWEAGSEMEMARFDNYHRGPAPIDRVIFRFISDPTAMVANVLSGVVDVVVPPGVDLDAAIELKRRWEGTTNRVVTGGYEDMNSAYTLQHRPELAQPRNGLPNRDVREALFRGINRTEMAEVITHGLAPIADSWISPMHAIRKDVESGIPQFPYDVARANQMLDAAGWTRGPDGVRVHSQTGERLKVELAGPVRAPLQKQQNIIADNWKAIGVEGEIFVIPSALDLIAETRSVRPGAYLGSIAAERYLYQDQMHSREVTSAANWNLRNRGGYVSPAADELQDRLRVTIDERQRTTLHRDLVRLVMQDVAIWPFYWDVYAVIAVESVKGTINPSKGGTFRNIIEWDKS